MATRLRSCPEQFSVLLEFMERSGDISWPVGGPQDRVMADRLWLEVVEKLNSTRGGVQKPVEKWKKVWADWKAKTKRKALTILRESYGGGGDGSGAPSTKPQRLTKLEYRLLGVMGLGALVEPIRALEKRVEGLPQAAGAGATNLIMEAVDSDDILLELVTIYSPNPMDESGSTSAACEELVPAEETSPTVQASPCSPQQTQCTATSPLMTTDPEGTCPIPDTTHEIPQKHQHELSPSHTPAIEPSQETTPIQTQVPIPKQSLSFSSSARRRPSHRVRRRPRTAFERLTHEYVNLEHRRLQREEKRERDLHERELLRLGVEEKKTEILAKIADSVSGILKCLLTGNSCDSLKNILKRTAAPTGLSEATTTILDRARSGCGQGTADGSGPAKRSKLGLGLDDGNNRLKEHKKQQQVDKVQRQMGQDHNVPEGQQQKQNDYVTEVSPQLGQNDYVTEVRQQQEQNDYESEVRPQYGRNDYVTVVRQQQKQNDYISEVRRILGQNDYITLVRHQQEQNDYVSKARPQQKQNYYLSEVTLLQKKNDYLSEVRPQHEQNDYVSEERLHQEQNDNVPEEGRILDNVIKLRPQREQNDYVLESWKEKHVADNYDTLSPHETADTTLATVKHEPADSEAGVTDPLHSQNGSLTHDTSDVHVTVKREPEDEEGGVDVQ